jgi:hypothetical protein
MFRVWCSAQSKALERCGTPGRRNRFDCAIGDPSSQKRANSGAMKQTNRILEALPSPCRPDSPVLAVSRVLGYNDATR